MKKFTFILLMILGVSNNITWGQTTTDITISGSFVIPAGVTSITVTCVGGGGGGGGAKGTYAGGGGGGGSL